MVESPCSSAIPEAVVGSLKLAKIALVCLGVCTVGSAVSCSRSEASIDAEPTRIATKTAPDAPDPYLDYPLYGLVSGAQFSVHKEPNPESLVVGWLRRGEVVRLKPAQLKTATCRSGWFPLHPQGYACAGEGIDVSDKAPVISDEDRVQAKRDAVMPYQYFLVKDGKAPEYHQLPSRDQQRAAVEYTSTWSKLEAEANAQKLKRFLEGTLPNQPKKHAVIRRFLERGFFVAATGSTVRSSRRFVHTARGSFIKEQQLEPRNGATFQGVALDAKQGLPVVWAVREAVPQRARIKDDGSVRFVDVPEAAPLARLSRLTNWKGYTKIGDTLVHELTDGTYLRHWFLAVAERMERPKEVKADEPWVHVDLSSQTLVLYVGDEPRYATLVSSGLPDHETTPGSFRIQRKYVSDSMSDIGADAESDRYSIDDVPWTQYFDGSRALHGAFWHAHFGIQRSHGCVNLAPADARYVFQHTEPFVPAGWHGMSTQKTGIRGSLVVITE